MGALARQGLMIDFPQRQGIYALRKPGNSDLLANHGLRLRRRISVARDFPCILFAPAVE
jgi:hypothetical protein